ncbi:MAG TPA: pyridoxamine 5'-phosphate oxidase family protein [Kribbellaceae bacterium]|nr:pyridoxamine 5'-phosphate oxidase family protein [Kribbellaceae bacterium]
MSRDDSRSRWFEPALFQHLPPEECRELLAVKSVGRVGFNGPDGPQVLPVNYVVHRRAIFFRTAVGSALADAMRNSRVAFEIDDIDEFLQSGWSVMAVGDAELVDDPDILVELWGDEGPKPWAVGLRTQFVRIRPIRFTGRRVIQQ